MDELFGKPAATSYNISKGVPAKDGGVFSDRAKALEQSLAVQTALVRCLLENGGLDGLACTLANLMRCCVVVEDGSPAVLTHAFPEDSLIAPRELLEPYMSVQASCFFKSFAQGKRKPGRAVNLADTYAGVSVYRLVFPIQIAGECTGYLSLLRTDAPFSDEEVGIAEHAALVVAVQLSQEKKVAEIELKLRGNFIEDLIFNFSSYSDPESILNRARALNYNIKLPHRVLVAEIENFRQIVSRLRGDQKAVARFKLELVKCVQSRLDLMAKGMATWHNNDIVMLVQLSEGDNSINTAKDIAEDIIRETSSLLKARMFVGIGCVCRELADYSKSYLSARKSLEIGAYMITEGYVRSLEQFKVHELFLSTLRPSELFEYAREQLSTLLDYDKRHGTDLIKTLQEYLYLRNSVEKTAKSLNMSVSGLKYRLKKIEKILGANLSDYKTSFDLQLALVILQLFGEYRLYAQDVPRNSAGLS